MKLFLALVCLSCSLTFGSELTDKEFIRLKKEFPTKKFNSCKPVIAGETCPKALGEKSKVVLLSPPGYSSLSS